MDEAASRVNPYDIKRLEKARQRREDRAQTELQIKIRLEREQEERVNKARSTEERAIKKRDDDTDEIYAGMIGKTFRGTDIEAKQRQVDWLKEIVQRKRKIVETEEAKLEKCVVERMEARKQYQIYNRAREVMSQVRKRVEKAIFERDEVALEMETEDGVIDRFGRDQESMLK